MYTSEVVELYKILQKQVIAILEDADGVGIFDVDHWQKDIGEGYTAVMQKGRVIEKAGVNFSHVQGEFTPNMAKILGENANSYSATGISSILHSNNPHVPTIHMNVRYFELDNGIAWFGGGIDLTPSYINISEAKEFHQKLKSICDKYDATFYPEWKNWADDYFFIPHRNETRGIGGIFFDRIKPKGKADFDNMLKLTAELTRAYPKIYSKLIRDNGKKTYTSTEKQWQKIRHGRYVEFNLVYDRGTKFGLESGGNTESILVSLPAEVEFQYKNEPITGSKEAETLELLKKGINWIDY